MPRAKLNAPMKSPTTTVETPIEVAKTAKMPAPATQSGQCADADLGKRVRITAKNNLRMF